MTVALDSDPFDPAASLVLAPRPYGSLQWIEPAPLLPRPVRVAILLAIAVLHLVLLGGMQRGHWKSSLPASDVVTTVVFLSRPQPAPAAPPSPKKRNAGSAEMQATTRRAQPPTVAEPTLSPRREGADPLVSTAEAAPTDRGARPTLFRADGSIEVPEDVTEDLARITRDDRTFGFQTPGLMASKTFAQRPVALVYEPTRFDEAWIDEKDIVSEALDKVVEKTTATVKIPVPGSPGSKVVCTVSLLAPGASCGIVNTAQSVIVLNDPETLDAEEDRQCREWWGQVVAAETQERWRAVRDRYDAQCRKPLADTAAQEL